MITKTFGEIRIGQRFIDPSWNEPCVKVSDTGAKDKYCAKDFVITFAPTDQVIVAYT